MQMFDVLTGNNDDINNKMNKLIDDGCIIVKYKLAIDNDNVIICIVEYKESEQ